jgi:EAL domain-containing protein (putative c-di-GMP-specific phosphodiesterase class I)
VETQSQLDRLMQIGCDKIQGFFISPRCRHKRSFTLSAI